MEIVDLKGEKQPFILKQNTVSLKSLKNGVYLFVFENEDGTLEIKKILKKY